MDGDTHDHMHLVSLTTFVRTSLHEAKLILVVMWLVNKLHLVDVSFHSLLNDIWRASGEEGSFANRHLNPLLELFLGVCWVKFGAVCLKELLQLQITA